MHADTSPEFEKVWIEMWRQKSPTFRLQRALAISDEVMLRSRAGIAAAHPDWSKQEVDLFWVELNYGRELANRLRNHLTQRV